MQISVDAVGNATMIYSDDFQLKEVGVVTVRRASHVEPDGDTWVVDLEPIGGPIVRGFDTRKEALVFEAHWIEEFYL